MVAKLLMRKGAMMQAQAWAILYKAVVQILFFYGSKS